jgi:hypothetical protein
MAVKPMPIKMARREEDLESSLDVITMRMAATNGARTRRCNSIREYLQSK